MSDTRGRQPPTIPDVLIVCMLFLYISVSNAAIVDDLTIVEEVLIMPDDLIGTAFGDLLHDAETRYGRLGNYEKNDKTDSGGTIKKIARRQPPHEQQRKTHGHPTLRWMLGRSR